MITKLYVTISNYLHSLKNDERGVTAIEYGLIAIAMAVALSAVFFSNADGTLVKELKDAFSDIAAKLNTRPS